MPTDFDVSCNTHSNLLLVENPYFQFMFLVKKWLELDAASEKHMIHSTAVISESAKIGKNTDIGANVVIEDDVIIGDNSKIEANCVLKKGVKTGKSVHFFPM